MEICKNYAAVLGTSVPGDHWTGRVYMLITQRENQMERLAAQAGLNTRTCAERLNGAIADSRQATYDGTLFEQYRQYRRQGSSGERIFSNGVQNYLNAQYSHKKK